MEVGLGLPNTIAGLSGPGLLEWIRLGERGPFSSLAALDRVLYDSYDPLATLSAAAAITGRIRLATMIVIGPLRNTAILGKTASTIQALSAGSFTLGVALGARRDDYTATGTDFSSRGARLNDQLLDLKAQWRSGEIGPHGGSTPELIIGGLNDLTFGRVARYGDGYMHNGGPPHIFERMAAKALAAWEDYGRPGKPRLVGMAYYSLGDDVQAEAGRRYLRGYYEFTGPFAERIAQGLLISPQAIVSLMRGYADAGCDELVLFPTSHDPDQVDRLAEVVG
ncbi:MAG: LLM class flavin-dependent oxidoreductase [Anaerolineales bacterium]|nr:LLM class flavin-dependent oxidoreductase [Anaerolineales bacterium]